MGGLLSKRASSKQPSSSYSWSHHSYSQSQYDQPIQEDAPHLQYGLPPKSHAGQPANSMRLKRKYSKINDDFNSLEQVTFHFCLLVKQIPQRQRK
uniref:Uncharacterized protein n=1 Tax=Rhizophora mucronata TaxID=61149 RepID=A0A2P2KTK5_RHIMU